MKKTDFGIKIYKKLMLSQLMLKAIVTITSHKNQRKSLKRKLNKIKTKWLKRLLQEKKVNPKFNQNQLKRLRLRHQNQSKRA